MNTITPFDPWKSKLCSCPQKYSLAPYTGCAHACLYCYASSYIRNFSLPRPKKDFLKKLENEIKKIPQNSIIAIANSCDPYQPLEKKIKFTRGALMILKNYPLCINIVTKSALILNDLDILKELKNVVIGFTLTTLSPRLTKRLEPNTANPQIKLKTIEKLAKNFSLALRLDPLVYPLNTPEIPKIIAAAKTSGVKQIITSTYKVKPDNFKRMCSQFKEHEKLWQKLYFTQGQRIGGYFYLNTGLRKKLITEVKEICTGLGLYFSSCREGFSGINTANCDGSAFFRAI